MMVVAGSLDSLLYVPWAEKFLLTTVSTFGKVEIN